MRYPLLFLYLICSCTMPNSASPTGTVSVYDFRKGTPVTDWVIEDDTVMGGRSQGAREMNGQGHLRFSGHVSLENNGGFSSVRHTLKPPVEVSGLDKFVVRVKGDGKDYTLRVKTDPANDYYYQASFPTSKEWQLVEVPFSEMSAVHHGESVDVPDFSGGELTEVQLLIGNKKEQDFSVLVDRIEAR